jgi:large repetitive protein
MEGIMSVKVLSCIVCLVSLAACGGGSGSTPGTMSPPTTYTVGGSVSGLSSGVSVSLKNGSASVKVSANGAFTFPSALASGSAYDVSIAGQPGGENCQLADASGTVSGAAVTNVSVTCSGTPSSAPAGISAANAPTLAAQAMLALNAFGGSSAASPNTATPSTTLAALKRLSRPSAATETTTNCAVSGTITVDPSADATSETDTFDACQETADLSLNGVLSYTGLLLNVTPTAASLTADVQDSLTVTLGALTEVENGSYDISLVYTPAISVVFDLSNVNLSALISYNGAPLDSENLSNANINLTEDLTLSPNQLYADFSYTLASTLLNGSVTADTTQTIKRIADPAVSHTFPYTGQVILLGSNGTRERITIWGDEIYLPSAGQGQVEIEFDAGTGTFAAPIWVNWSTLEQIIIATINEQSGGGTPATATYSIGGALSGLAAGATVSLNDNGTDPLTLSADGRFTFLTELSSGSAYSVSVQRQPAGQTCTIVDLSGAVNGANITNIAVTCQ